MRIPDSIRRATVAILILASIPVINSCSKGPTEATSIVGRWTGYNSFGTGSNGWATMAIDGDHHCELTGAITGEYGAWGGAYKLRFEGTPTYYNNQVFGDIWIWRYRTGIDTVRAAAWWSGEFNLKTGSVVGGWVVDQGEPFGGQGDWAATKEH